MDELSNIEARRDFNVANLRRAFGALDPVTGTASQACPFASLLARLAARGAASPKPEGAPSEQSRGRAQA